MSGLTQWREQESDDANLRDPERPVFFDGEAQNSSLVQKFVMIKAARDAWVLVAEFPLIVMIHGIDNFWRNQQGERDRLGNIVENHGRVLSSSVY